MRRSLVPATLGLIVAAGLAVPVLSTPAPAAATCQGRTATHVGAPGGELRATDGPDVVITNGAYSVDTLDGDDVVCVTRNGVPDTRRGDVDTGRGADDVVVTLPAGQDAYLTLGNGADTLRGGASREHVFDSDSYGDVIETGAGSDVVKLGGRVIADQVRLGADGGALSLYGLDDRGVGPDAVLDGGVRGRSSIVLHLDGSPDTWAVVNGAVAGTAQRADGTGASFRWTRFWSVKPGDADVTFRGSSLADRLVGVSPRSAATFSGNDQVRLDVPPAPGVRPVLDLGAGRDLLTVVGTLVDTGPALVVDGRSGQVRSAGARVAGLAGVEDFDVTSAARVTVHGTPARNRITVHGCPGTALGGPGDDVLIARVLNDLDIDRSCTDGGSFGRLLGGTGDDELVGTRYDDVLDGGPGRDRANGSLGRDTCRAEVRRGCER